MTLLSRLEDSESFSARFDKSHPVRLSAWSTAKLAMQANGSVSFRYFRKCFQKLETQLMVLEAPTFLLLILFNLVLLSFNSSVLILLQVRGFDLQSTPSRYHSYFILCYYYRSIVTFIPRFCSEFSRIILFRVWETSTWPANFALSNLHSAESLNLVLPRLEFYC